MRILNIIFFASLVGSCWCGLISHNIRDGLHSKLYGHGLHGNQQSPIISINNQQQMNQITANQHLQNRPYGGYSSLQHGQQVYGQNGYNSGASNYAGINGYTGSSASSSSSLYGGASSSASSSSFGAGGRLKPWSNHY